MDKMHSKKSGVKKGIGIVCAILGFINLTSCNSNESGSNEYQKLVKTVRVEEISSVKEKQFPGVMKEAEEVNLAFRVAGPLAKIHITEGQFVKKGQLIAEMDDRDYIIQKNAIETQVQQLQSEYERIAELNKRKAVPDNDYEKMKAGKEIAEVKLKNASDQLRDTKLYAPFSGYITKVMFKVGELVNHGTPVAKLIDISLLKVEIDVPASMYMHKGDIIKIECTQDNLPGETFHLTLSGNNIKANNNGLYRLYLNYKPEQESKLLPGMNVLVKISYKTGDSDLSGIPVEALYTKNGDSYVWVVNENKVHARKVTSNNIIKNGTIGITRGLKPGEEIVIGGLNLLSEGESVKIIPPQSKTNIGNIL